MKKDNIHMNMLRYYNFIQMLIEARNSTGNVKFTKLKNDIFSKMSVKET
jgi:hypothetical protein